MVKQPNSHAPTPAAAADLTELAAAFVEHRPRLLAWLNFRIPPALRRRLDPNDVLQEAFRLAGRKYRTQRDRATSLFVFLFWVVRECYLRQWEEHTRACRDLRRELPWPEESSRQLLLGLVAPDSAPSAVVARTGLEQRVQQVLALLPADDMEVVALRYFGGDDKLSFADIAGVLGIAEDAARQRHARALVRFAKLWKRSASEENKP